MKELIAKAKTSLDVFKQIISISTRQNYTLENHKNNLTLIDNGAS